MSATVDDLRVLAVAPERSVTQRMTALARANKIRTRRAEWKKEVKRGDVDPLVVLFEPPADFESMKVFDAMLAMPKLGRVKVNKALQWARISPSKTLGGMTERQRRELRRYLP